MDQGVDWITATCSDVDRRDQMKALGVRLVEDEHAEGDDIKTWGGHGYFGFGTKRATWGARREDVLVRLSGGLARDWWKPVAELATSVSRVDLQVTARAEPADEEVCKQAYESAKAKAEQGKSKMAVRRICGRFGEQTTYVGSRTSDTYARIYDKGIEQSTASAGNIWRWEIECKRRSASRALESARPGCDGLDTIRPTVWSYFDDRGASPEWTRLGESGRLGAGRQQTDDQRRILWLKRAVKPVVAHLLVRYSRDELLEVLGLRE